MNVKEYISSGIVESYVLGLLTDAERHEFEAVCTTHPEVAEARNAFELSLEEQMRKDAIQPPKHLKQQVEGKLSTTSTESGPYEEEEITPPVRTMGAWKWLAAASLILLAGAAFWAISTNNKYQKLQNENTSLQEQLQKASEDFTQLNAEAEMLRKPGMKMAALKGTAHSPQSFATVYWDTTKATRDVYLLVNNLPEPPSGKQYQLWALLNGTQTDLGVFDMDMVKQNRLLVKMQNVQNAQAFAITLEPAGGSAKPTLESMYVMGAL